MEWEIAQKMADASYVFGMAVGCLCELEAMKAANRERQNKGEMDAYDEKAFNQLMLDRGMHHNAIVSASNPR